MDTVDRHPTDGNGDNPTRLTTSVTHDYSPAWFPDGSKIAFAGDLDVGAGPDEIFVMDTTPSTNDATNLTNNAALDSSPAWSPDGKKIAFASYRGEGDTDIYVMKAKPEGKKNRPKNLTKNDVVSNYKPDWQPLP